VYLQKCSIFIKLIEFATSINSSGCCTVSLVIVAAVDANFVFLVSISIFDDSVVVVVAVSVAVVVSSSFVDVVVVAVVVSVVDSVVAVVVSVVDSVVAVGVSVVVDVVVVVVFVADGVSVVDVSVVVLEGSKPTIVMCPIDGGSRILRFPFATQTMWRYLACVDL